MAATVKPVNYTDEQTAEMVKLYTVDKMTTSDIAQKFGKTVRSVIAKLSREKVYVKKVYTTKNGEKVQKKDETADAIGAVLKLSENDIDSLTKANKTALRAIFEALANSKPV